VESYCGRFQIVGEEVELSRGECLGWNRVDRLIHVTGECIALVKAESHVVGQAELDVDRGLDLQRPTEHGAVEAERSRNVGDGEDDYRKTRTAHRNAQRMRASRTMGV